MKMRLEDAIVYVLATSGRGMTTDAIADRINRDSLHLRADGNPVSSNQIYAIVCRNQSVFAKEGGRITLLM